MNLKKKITFSFFTFLLAIISIEFILYSAGKIYLLKTNPYTNTQLTNDEFRILCLGESTTALGLENSYPSLLEKRLNKISNKKFKVINAGMAATTTDNILNDLDDNLNLYKPDLVILMAGINDHTITHLKKRPFYKNLKTYKLISAILERFNTKNIATKSPRENSWEEPTSYYLDYEKKIRSKLNNHTDNILNIIKQSFKNDRLNGFDILKIIALIQESRPESFYNSKETLDGIKSLFLKAIEKEPKNVMFYDAYLGFLNNEYSLFYNDKLGITERPKDLITYSHKALQIDPSLATAHFYIGLIYLENDLFKKAEPYLKKTIELKPYDFDFWWPYIKNFLKMKEYQKALETCQKAIDLNPFENRFVIIQKKLYDSMKNSDYKEVTDFDFIGHSPNPNPYIIPKTVENLQQIATKIMSSNSLLAFMQYPLRDPSKMERIIDHQNLDNVTLIKNYSNFKSSLKANGYESLFWDKFAGDFGHATKKGQLLIVDNIITTLNDKWCPKIKKLCLQPNSIQ